MIHEFYKKLEKAMRNHFAAVSALTRVECRVNKLDDQIEALEAKLEQKKNQRNEVNWQADQLRKKESEAYYVYKDAYQKTRLCHGEMFPGEPSEVKLDAWEGDFNTRFGYYGSPTDPTV